MVELQKTLISLYIEYYNNYLTLEAMAEDKGIDRGVLTNMVYEGRGLYHMALQT